MPGCIFGVYGDQLDLEMAKSLGFEIDRIVRKGDLLSSSKNKTAQTNYFLVVASSPDSMSLDEQIVDAELFLSQHAGMIQSLKGVDEMVLDFAYDCRIGAGEGGNQIWVQGEYLPVTFLKKCGELNVNIALSLYATSDQKIMD